MSCRKLIMGKCVNVEVYGFIPNIINYIKKM